MGNRMRMSLFRLWSVAVYEAKLVMRSAVFVIFPLVAAPTLLYSGLTLNKYWTQRGVSSIIPYRVVMYLTLVQAVFALFFVLDGIGREQRMNALRTIRIRPQANSEYVIGKALGLALVFLLLNACILGGAFLCNTVFLRDVAFVPLPYALYPLMVTLPALVFASGLAFFVLMLFRSIVISAVLPAFLVAGGAYYAPYLSGFFDSTALRLPLLYSDFVGFGNLPVILLQRGMYLFAGLSLLLASISLLPRLPRSRWERWTPLLLALLCAGGAYRCGETYLSVFFHAREVRERARLLNASLCAEPTVAVTDCRITLKHAGNSIESAAALTFRNSGDDSLHRYLFSLNPGLTVLAVDRGGEPLRFVRNLHTLLIETPGGSLPPGVIDSLTIHYRGRIVENVCYTDIPEGEREFRNTHYYAVIDKRYGFVTPKYVLLTRENRWYPMPGVPHGPSPDEPSRTDFTRFRLTVETSPGLTALSQGAARETGPGQFSFAPETPLPQLSLVIGRYRKRAVNVDGVECSIYTRPGHDRFVTCFESLDGEKTGRIIRGVKNEYESLLNRNYPFPRFSLVEAPVQFLSHPRLWTLCPETVQPEQVFFAEQGVINGLYDYEILANAMQHQPALVLTREEIDGLIIKEIFENTLFSKANSLDMSRWVREQHSGYSRINGKSSPFAYDYAVFPHYYWFTNTVFSGRYPFFDLVVGCMLKSNVERVEYASALDREDWRHVAIRALMRRSFREILHDATPDYIRYDVVAGKAVALSNWLKSRTGMDELAFSRFLRELLDSHRFSPISLDEFAGILSDRFGVDVMEYLEQWYTAEGLPKFEFYEKRFAPVTERGKRRYQASFTVYNKSPHPGLLKLHDKNRYIYLEGNQAKQVNTVCNAHFLVAEMFIAQNMPSQGIEMQEIKMTIDQPVESERVVDVSGRTPESNPPVERSAGLANRETVVDNRSSGFSILTRPEGKLLTKLLGRDDDRDEELLNFSFSKPPDRWRYVSGPGFYQFPENTVHFVRAGRGEQRIRFAAELPDDGRHEVLFALPALYHLQQPGPSRIPDPVKDFHFRIRHEKGVEEITLDVGSLYAEKRDGWISLGTYMFSRDQAVVELSDESTGAMVFADAVKWVKRSSEKE